MFLNFRLGFLLTAIFLLFSFTSTFSQSIQNLNAALTNVRKHQLGQQVLSFDQLKNLTVSIPLDTGALSKDSTLFKLAVEIVKHYETTDGPVFMNSRTPRGWKKDSTLNDGKTYDRVIVKIQQAIHTSGITPFTIANWNKLINGLGFKTSEYFPGKANPPQDLNKNYTAKINASLEVPWGRPTWNTELPVRRPTGYYLAPGSIGRVVVPDGMINKGYTLLVGSHTHSKKEKTYYNRFDDVVKVYPILSRETQIANPFGGGIYVVVPYKSSLGLVDITISNVIPAPFYSSLPYRKTSLNDWVNTERKNPAPWADFQTENFQMNIPTNFIYNHPDASVFMNAWDKAMVGFNTFRGYPSPRNREVLYLQVDAAPMNDGFAGIGYPQTNTGYNPATNPLGNAKTWYLSNTPIEMVEFHEMGHEARAARFNGEIESFVHVGYVYVANAVFGMNLDTAFQQSSYGARGAYLENVAVYTMTREDFLAGKDMEWLSYFHTGHAKYIELAYLFGWGPIIKMHENLNKDYEQGDKSMELDQDASKRILNFSKAAGEDMSPLFHFWGRQPSKTFNLGDSLRILKIPKSQKIYDRLMYYKKIIPKNKTEYEAAIERMFPGETAAKNNNYGFPDMYKTLQTYDDNAVKKVDSVVQSIITMYFPQGRPAATTPVSSSPNTFHEIQIFKVNSQELQFFAPTSGNYVFELFDLSGKLVESKTRNIGDSGIHLEIWTKNLNACGVHFVKIRAGELSTSAKVKF